MRLLIAQNEDLHTRLWRVFRSKVEGKGKLLTIGVDDRSLEAIKRRSCHINYRFGNIPVHVHKEKPRKETSEEASGGKLTEVPEEVAEAIEAERTGSTREIDLLPSEEQKLDDLDLGLLGLGVDTDAQESAMSEEEGEHWNSAGSGALGVPGADSRSARRRHAEFLTGDLVAIQVSLEVGRSTRKVVVASGYFPGDESRAPPEQVAKLTEYCEERALPLLLGCDANAHHVVWGSSDTNRRETGHRGLRCTYI
ncbi:unnamed protein product [Hermetia illucens]|uniref:DUF4780 domain-containing protein n=1 Tax=Hermetia illucens TaxID=343691 RepID=A0A7R8YTJ2_HERIL|nr:unnamed protein product [Hermetia illucens]